LLARDGNRRGSGPARPYWRGICQRPAWPGSRDYDCRGYPASRRGAGAWLVDADVLSHPVLGHPVIGHPGVVRRTYGYADRHSFTDSLSHANRHANTDTDTDTDAIGYPNRQADI
jgi:hypothetical protein